MKKLIFVLFVIVFCTNPLTDEIKEKIAICSDGKDENSLISELAGRAQFFHIYESSGKLIEIVENPYKDAKSGAGIKALEFLEKKGVNLFVANKFGTGIRKEMDDKGIKGMEFKGTVKEALGKLLK